MRRSREGKRRKRGRQSYGSAPHPSPLWRQVGRETPRADRPSVQAASAQQRLELLRLCDWPLAGESLAHVGGGAVVDRGAALEQWNGPVAGVSAREHEVRPEAPAHDPLERSDLIADECHLLHRREVEVERLEQVRERVWVLRRDLVQKPEDAERALLVPVLAAQEREPEKAVRGARIAGRDRVVLEILTARDEALVVVGRLEEAAPLLVGEVLDREV